MLSLGSGNGNGAVDSTSSISDVDDWLVYMQGEFLRGRSTLKIGTIHKILFCRVPKPLLDSSKCFYIPQVVSIGPLHFGTLKLRFELHKVEAMRRMESRIQKTCPQLTLTSIVEGEIMDMEKSIRDCYDEKIPYGSKQLAWMVTSDACFIYEFILFHCRNVQSVNVEEEWIPAAKYDCIFDSCAMDPIWKMILFDLLLLENQIPLSVLELLVEIAMGSTVALEEKFHKKLLASLISRRSVGVFSWFVLPPCKKGENPHLLDAFYRAAVGPINSPRHDAEDDDDHVQDFLLPNLPSATELKQEGVKFHCIPPTTECSPIQCVGFDEKTATLWLPQINVDVLRIALISNFIAMEVTNAVYAPYPMTSFAILMNELIHNGEDCRLLIEARIIVNMLGSDEKVAKAFKSIIHSMEMRPRTCKSIENVRAGLCNYLKKKRHIILWREFYSACLSPPWYVAGLVAACFFLLMTVVQIFFLSPFD